MCSMRNYCCSYDMYERERESTCRSTNDKVTVVVTQDSVRSSSPAVWRRLRSKKRGPTNHAYVRMRVSCLPRRLSALGYTALRGILGNIHGDYFIFALRITGSKTNMRDSPRNICRFDPSYAGGGWGVMKSTLL